MALPKGSTSTKMSSSLPSMQRQPTLKWVGHSTLLYISALKFIPAIRNCFWTKEMYHTWRLCSLNCENEKRARKARTRKEFLPQKCYVCSWWAKSLYLNLQLLNETNVMGNREVNLRSSINIVKPLHVLLVLVFNKFMELVFHSVITN